MKTRYIPPVTETIMIQSMHVICGSRGEIRTSPTPGNPNVIEIF